MSQKPLKQIEFYFDFACPYAYLASTRLTELSAHADAEITLKPVLLGGIFRSLEQPQNMSTTLSPAKARHNRLEPVALGRLARGACGRRCGTPTGRSRRCVVCSLRRPRRRSRSSMPSTPCIGVTPPTLATLQVLAGALDQLGLDSQAILAHATSQPIKDELRQRTDEAVARGVFGVPTFFVGDELFFGQDRIEMVAEAANGWEPDRELMDAFHFNQTSNEAR